jgi:hypothetical protein
MVETGILL